MMASNCFGQIFRITTWGESHGKAIGVVIDGCPSGLEISEEEINQALLLRQGGRSLYTTPRKESDSVEILSGIFNGITTGAPISLIIYNQNWDSSKYEPIKDILRPGHANFTYLEKYGIFDYRGGGRASARETACRVAAGAVAKKLLQTFSITWTTFIAQIAEIAADVPENITVNEIHKSPIFCPDPKACILMEEKLQSALSSGNSLGGIIECRINNVPAGLGDPVYEKLQANLAKAMLSIPACKGIEFGAGFASCNMSGLEHNDPFMQQEDGRIQTGTNHAGGLLGGISTGMPLTFRVAMKPAASIKLAQATVTTSGAPATLTLPEGSRHDSCVAIRAVPVVEAMAALVLVDAVLMNQVSQLRDR
jgi:chorismate synthase